jgi:ABC-2 type transport system ATP-binding protein
MPTPDRAVILRTEGLTKRFGERTAVNGLSLEVRQGDVFGLLGPNGSGKTTTLRMVLGLIWPTAGTISLFGAPLSTSAQRRAALRRVGSIIEQPSFYPYLSASENLRGVGIFAGLRDDDTLRRRIGEVLFYVGLTPRANDAYKTYSLGMKQRLGVAAALLTNPELVILDEPTNGLDPAGMVEVRTLIGQLAQRGITVVISSHLLHEIQQVCTCVAILKEGSLVAQGTVSELLGAGRGILLAFDRPERYADAVSVLQAAAAAGATWLRGAQYVRPEPGARMPPGGWLLLVDAPFERVAEVSALLAARGIYPIELRPYEMSLEQFFLAQTGTPQPSALPGTAPPYPAQPYAAPPYPTPAYAAPHYPTPPYPAQPYAGPPYASSPYAPPPYAPLPYAIPAGAPPANAPQSAAETPTVAPAPPESNPAPVDAPMASPIAPSPITQPIAAPVTTPLPQPDSVQGDGDSPSGDPAHDGPTSSGQTPEAGMGDQTVAVPEGDTGGQA